MITNFLLKKKINPTPYSSNIEFQKEKKEPSMQPCAFIIPYYNMKLPKPLITLSHPNIPYAILKN